MLFLDESGHDHRNTPYEVRGGIAVQAAQLWPLTTEIRELERSTFGCLLSEVGSEIKGARLLDADRFKWERQGPRFDEQTRAKHALNFLNSCRQGRTPRRHEFTAYGQACISMAERAIELLRAHDVYVFASIIPRIRKPKGANPEFLRKDHAFLFERFFYFLEGRDDVGFVVMDETDKQNDRRFIRQMEQYFTRTERGRERTARIVPVPLFVSSDMVYGVQLADLCIYCLNWGYRFADMIESTRSEIEPFTWLMEPMIWEAQIEHGTESFTTHSVFYLPDPFTPRSA